MIKILKRSTNNAAREHALQAQARAALGAAKGNRLADYDKVADLLFDYLFRGAFTGEIAATQWKVLSELRWLTSTLVTRDQAVIIVAIKLFRRVRHQMDLQKTVPAGMRQYVDMSGISANAKSLYGQVTDAMDALRKKGVTSQDAWTRGRLLLDSTVLKMEIIDHTSSQPLKVSSTYAAFTYVRDAHTGDLPLNRLRELIDRVVSIKSPIVCSTALKNAIVMSGVKSAISYTHGLVHYSSTVAERKIEEMQLSILDALDAFWNTIGLSDAERIKSRDVLVNKQGSAYATVSLYEKAFNKYVEVFRVADCTAAVNQVWLDRELICLRDMKYLNAAIVDAFPAYINAAIETVLRPTSDSYAARKIELTAFVKLTRGAEKRYKSVMDKVRHSYFRIAYETYLRTRRRKVTDGDKDDRVYLAKLLKRMRAMRRAAKAGAKVSELIAFIEELAASTTHHTYTRHP